MIHKKSRFYNCISDALLTSLERNKWDIDRLLASREISRRVISFLTLFEFASNVLKDYYVSYGYFAKNAKKIFDGLIIKNILRDDAIVARIMDDTQSLGASIY